MLEVVFFAQPSEKRMSSDRDHFRVFHALNEHPELQEYAKKEADEMFKTQSRSLSNKKKVHWEIEKDEYEMTEYSESDTQLPTMTGDPNFENRKEMSITIEEIKKLEKKRFRIMLCWVIALIFGVALLLFSVVIAANEETRKLGIALLSAAVVGTSCMTWFACFRYGKYNYAERNQGAMQAN